MKDDDALRLITASGAVSLLACLAYLVADSLSVSLKSPEAESWSMIAAAVSLVSLYLGILFFLASDAPWSGWTPPPVDGFIEPEDEDDLPYTPPEPRIEPLLLVKRALKAAGRT